MKRLATAGVLLAAMGGVAVAGTGVPSEWQMNMQGQVTELGRGVRSFHDLLLWIITGICLLVGVLLAIVIVRFREDKNPVPARTTHNTLLEVAWTVAPVAILVAIAIPSFRLLREQLVIPQADVVVKTTGYSWYWGYEYPADQGGFKFDSNMVPESDLQPGQLRLLAVDNEMVVPVNKVVKVQVTSADVLHSFAVPAFAIKVDAVPGRLNETWFKADREGIYYGQCSELCGNGHPYMPIAVRVVSEQQYSAWLAEAKQKYAAVPAPTRVANAQ
nr:cytochrome c oxidase subunit II [Microvirga massiliensis]